MSSARSVRVLFETIIKKKNNRNNIVTSRGGSDDCGNDGVILYT